MNHSPLLSVTLHQYWLLSRWRSLVASRIYRGGQALCFVTKTTYLILRIMLIVKRSNLHLEKHSLFFRRKYLHKMREYLPYQYRFETKIGRCDSQMIKNLVGVIWRNEAITFFMYSVLLRRMQLWHSTTSYIVRSNVFLPVINLQKLFR